MVLASNEWLTNCDDEQKSTTSTTATSNTNTTAAATTAAAAAAAAAASADAEATTHAVDQVTQRAAHPRETQNSDSSTTITDYDDSTISATSLTLTSTNRNDNANANNELIQLDLAQLLSMINNSSSGGADNQQIMGDHLNTTGTDQLSIDALKRDEDADATINVESADNNNHASAETLTKPTSSHHHETKQIENALSNTTNTLQSSGVLRLKVIPPPPPPQETSLLKNRITPQALNSALQTALNSAAANNAGHEAAQMQNNFLSSLGIEIGGGGSSSSSLQHAVKPAVLTLDGSGGGGSNSGGGGGIVIVDTAHTAHVVMHDSNGHAKIVLLCETNSHPFQTRSIHLTPNIECKVGRLIAKSKASESNAIFDCKVLSRNHAVLWYTDDGKFWVKDTKSSNGTFINENKLGVEAAELHFGDIVKFGVDVLENSRKEVHGCIIACVKLYMPDGREAISIDANTGRSVYSGEGRISYDELHRLNLYMQEASQREKVLKSKLFNIQNILDATRKNSALCWQSMIAEDQLLHRINSLEKKLQIMDKNVPESALRNEVLKLLEDKNSYQHTAKEALRKVYQERCDAMQMLAKMENAYAASENECKLLRDQIMNTKQSLQDVNARLLRLESEYHEYKEASERHALEAKESSEQRLMVLTENLNDRDYECAEFKRRLTDLMREQEEKLQHQALAKLDAAIADMDLGEDDDDDDDDDDDVDHDRHEEAPKRIDENARKYNSVESEKKKKKMANQRRRKSKLNDSDESIDSNVVDGESSGSEKEKTKSSPKSGKKPQIATKHNVVKKKTILNWLKNSDLNDKEGSVDIFKAICNESDSSSDHEHNAACRDDGTAANKIRMTYKGIKQKLRRVQNTLNMLEATVAKEASSADGSTAVCDDSDDEDEENEAPHTNNSVASKRNSAAMPLKAIDGESLKLLHTSLVLLRECHDVISANTWPTREEKTEQESQPPAFTAMRVLQNCAQPKPDGGGATKKLETQETLKQLNALKEENDNDDSDKEDDDNDDRDEADEEYSSDATTATQKAANWYVVNEQAQRRIAEVEKQVETYQLQILQLNEKLVHVESDANNTLEIMQIECDRFKKKVASLIDLTNTLRDEKSALEHVINENRSNAMKIASEAEKEEPLLIAPREIKSSADVGKTDSDGAPTKNVEKASPKTSTTAETAAVSAVIAAAMTAHTFELQMSEDLAVINSNVMQREEELIMYKERLEQTQSDNLILRYQIDQLKEGTNRTTQMVKNVLPYGVAVIAVMVLFLTAAYY